MKLIADSGSTKTDWVLIRDNAVVGRYQTQGINPFHQSEDDILNILRSELLTQLSPSTIHHPLSTIHHPLSTIHHPLSTIHYSPSTKILLEALLMCVISPCATAAAVVTQKLGGSLEQMTTYTFLSNFLTALLVPICFPLIEKSADITFLTAFLKILHEVFLVLVMPMLLAYIVKHYLQRLHRKIIAIRDLSYYLWACSLMIVTGTTVRNIVHAEASVWLLTAIALLGLIICIVQFAVGRFIGHFFDHTQEAGQALGQKNTAFAIWLSSVYLNPLSSVGPGCYILWQNIVNSIEIWKHDKQ